MSLDNNAPSFFPSLLNSLHLLVPRACLRPARQVSYNCFSLFQTTFHRSLLCFLEPEHFSLRLTSFSRLGVDRQRNTCLRHQPFQYSPPLPVIGSISTVGEVFSYWTYLHFSPTSARSFLLSFARRLSGASYGVRKQRKYEQDVAPTPPYGR